MAWKKFKNLWKPEAEQAIQESKGRTLQDDTEIKILLQIKCISALESRIFSWHKIESIVAMVLRCKKLLLRKIQKGEIQDEIINNNLLKETEIKVIKMMLAKKNLLQKLGPQDQENTTEMD